MKTSENAGKLFEALSKAQNSFPPIEKNKSVEIITKTGRKINFDYADLQEILSKTKKALTENGLAISQLVMSEESKDFIYTILGHSSGEQLVSKIILSPEDSSAKSLGASLTYLRRYSISAILNICADEDNDAPDESNKKVTPRGVPNKSSIAPGFVSPSSDELVKAKLGIIKALLGELTNGDSAAQKVQFIKVHLGTDWPTISGMNLTELDPVERKLAKIKAAQKDKVGKS